VTHQFVTAIGANGAITQAQPAAADVSGLAASATTDTTNAGNIGSGTLNASRLPATVVLNNQANTFSNVAAPSTPATGSVAIWADSTNKVLAAKNENGTVSNTVVPSTAGSNQFATGVSGSGIVAYRQPSFADISGLAAATQLPNPTASTLGGVQSLATASHQFVNSISTSGVPGTAQPSSGDLSD